MAMNPIGTVPNSAAVKPPIRTIGTTASTATATAAAALTGDATTDTINKLLVVWKTALTGRTVSPSNGALAGKTLISIFDTLMNSFTVSGFRALWNFFKENRLGCCMENRALIGIEAAMPDRNARKKYITLYNAFRAFTMNYKPAMSDKEFLTVIPNPQIFKLLSNAR